jgi:hypothetical protein
MSYVDSQSEQCWLAWAAGFIDGEASIQINKASGKQRMKLGSTPQVHLYVRADQVDEKPLKRLQEMFGGSLYHRPPRGTTQQPQWVWTIQSRSAYQMLIAIRPWLTVKAERADLAICFHESCQAHRPVGINKRLSTEEFGERLAYHDAMKSLNLRGKAAMEKEQVIQ